MQAGRRLKIGVPKKNLHAFTEYSTLPISLSPSLSQSNECEQEMNIQSCCFRSFVICLNDKQFSERRSQKSLLVALSLLFVVHCTHIYKYTHLLQFLFDCVVASFVISVEIGRMQLKNGQKSISNDEFEQCL